MTMETNLAGRIRNTSLALSTPLLPLFEAVANAIHAVEDTGGSLSRGRIRVEIRRETSLGFTDDSASRNESSRSIEGFIITDNGVGFTDANYRSFGTLDSEHKRDRGGRGVGRLSWLKAFRAAEIRSVYTSEDGKLARRDFRFSLPKGIVPLESKAVARSPGSEIQLLGFEARYKATAPKTCRAIANQLLDHCLWYFVRPGGAPQIEVHDDQESLRLDDLYESHMQGASKAEEFSIGEHRFILAHLRLSVTSGREHAVSFCASKRQVLLEPLKGKISGLTSTLQHGGSDFIYHCYVESPLLDERVSSERTAFDLAETPEGLFGHEVSKQQIRSEILQRASAYLRDSLAEASRASRERINEFVGRKAPRYRPIMERIDPNDLTIEAGISDKDLELHLHKQLARLESEQIELGHSLLRPIATDELESYSARLEQYASAAVDLKKSDLANYVFHRRVIIDLLENALNIGDNGKYAREKLIHSLVMPMGKTSHETHPANTNLWLLDEKLAFHDYLASDKPIRSTPVTGSKDLGEPDLLALQLFDNPFLASEKEAMPLASVVVVEFKRPMRSPGNRREDDPIEQALLYLDKVRRGKVTTHSGRPVPTSPNVPGFCYVVCDLTEAMRTKCRLKGYTQSPDQLAFFSFNPNFNAYVEVVSFDHLVNSARMRNRAFFDMLGLPTE